MNLNDYFASTLANTLEETSNYMGNALVLNHLAKNGSVSLEESEFFHTICTDVITEAAEDFIPDTLDVPDEQDEVYYDKDGNAYMLSNGAMVPVDGGSTDDSVQDPSQIAESNTITESTTAGQNSEDLLEENDNVVARILANLK